jgi:predicted CXXCH cytochrome family protein
MPGRRPRPSLIVVLAAALGVLVVGAGVYGWRSGRLPAILGLGQGPARVGFADEASCGSCHATQQRAWADSHHAKAMQPATARTVLGDFNDARFEQGGAVTRFLKRGDKFVVNTEGPDGKPADFEIAHTFGVEPLQQYLVPFPGGRLQSLTIAWDTKAKRWFSLYPAEKFAPDDPLHWTGRYQNWNLMCAECHATDLRKGYDARSDTYRTTWVALNVGCQACHGPGEAHVAWARAGKPAAGAKAAGTGLAVDLQSSAAVQVDGCGRCHSRRTPLAEAERPGRPLLDEYRVETLREDLYHVDGQLLGEVYEWGSFRQSKMFQRGVRCTDCHDAHGAGLKATGNGLCTQCHREAADPRFPTLKAKPYDSPAHHFHKAGSPGAQCVACHMPERNYMILDGRRDHSLRVPRPDLSVSLGTPNACSSCHTDRPPQWAAAAVQKWYGGQRAPHWAQAVAAGRAGARDGASPLIALATDAAQPAIVRATAVGTLRRYGAAAPVIVAATRDGDAIVRAAAASALEILPPTDRLAAGAPLLKDPVRSVRLETARVLASVPAALFDTAQRQAFDAALAEFKAAQAAMADMPASHLNLAVVLDGLGQREQAVAAYETALRLDPQFLPARANLARLHNAMGKNAEAERVLREGVKRVPTEGELHYSLGLLLAETNRLHEAVGPLGEAARLLPTRARVLYNYGLALDQVGRRPEAEAALIRAQELDRTDPQMVYALVVFYARQQQPRRALAFAEMLAQLVPADPRARQLVEGLRREAEGRR